jgi:hypothetical protein
MLQMSASYFFVNLFIASVIPIVPKAKTPACRMFDDVRKRFLFFFIPFTQDVIHLTTSGKIVSDTDAHACIEHDYQRFH